jgi:hypothetical protein
LQARHSDLNENCQPFIAHAVFGEVQTVKIIPAVGSKIIATSIADHIVT